MKSLFGLVDHFFYFLRDMSVEIKSKKDKSSFEVIKNNLFRISNELIFLIKEIKKDEHLLVLKNSKEKKVINFIRDFNIILNKMESVVSILLNDLELMVKLIEKGESDIMFDVMDTTEAIVASGLDEEVEEKKKKLGEELNEVKIEMAKFRKLEINHLRQLITLDDFNPQIIEAEKYIINLFN